MELTSITAIYSQAPVTKALTAVSKGDTNFFIDRNGQLISEEEFGFERRFPGQEVLVKKGDSLIILNEKGEQLWKADPDFDFFIPYGEIKDHVYVDFVLPKSYALACHETYSEKHKLYETGFVYIVDLKTGKDVKLKEYFMHREFSDGLLPVAWKRNREIFELPMIDGAKWGFVDKFGHIQIPIQFDDVTGFSEGLAAVQKHNRWFFIDKKGYNAFNKKFNYASEFQNGVAVVANRNKFGLINSTGEWVIPADFHSMSFAGEEMLKVKHDSGSKYAVMNNEGKLLSEFIYDDFHYIGNQRAIFKIDNKFYLNNLSDGSNKQLNIDEITYFSNRRIVVKVGHLFGIIDDEGNWILPAEYNYIADF